MIKSLILSLALVYGWLLSEPLAFSGPNVSESDSKVADNPDKQVICSLVDIDGQIVARINRSRSVSNNLSTFVGRMMRHPVLREDRIFGKPFIWTRGADRRCGLSDMGRINGDGAVLDADGRYLGMVTETEIVDRYGQVVAALGPDCGALPAQIRTQYAGSAALLSILFSRLDRSGQTFLAPMDHCQV